MGRRSFTFYFYQSLGASPCSGYQVPSGGVIIPNLFLFSVVTFLTVMNLAWKIPRICAIWTTCILDTTESFPLVAMFYLNMFYKTRSKRLHFKFLTSLLPFTKCSKQEVALVWACTINNVSHQIQGSFADPHPVTVAIFTSYLTMAYVAFMSLIHFTVVIKELNDRFSILIKKTHRISRSSLAKQWVLFDAIESINYVYGPTLLMMTVWLSGKLVNNLYKAAIELIRYENFSTFSFLCVSAIVKFIVFFCAARVCEQTKQLAEAFNNELFMLMRQNQELCNDSKLFLYVTMKRTVNFTACGFFNLGYPLVTSIIAAATTYLVILLQFSMPNN